MATDLMKSTRGNSDCPQVHALVRDMLWPMVRANGTRRVLNRVRSRPGEPRLPYRIVVYPIEVDDTVIGLLAGLRDQMDRPFEDADLGFLAQTALTLQTTMRECADAHTSLLLRSAFDLEVASRCLHCDCACVVYVDLDQIHAVNELSGLDMGDRLIRDVGRLLHAHLPASNAIATHLSGDRYLVALFGLTLTQSSDWAEQLRQAIEQLEWAGQRVQISASFGVAVLPGASDLQGALAAAETACRVAKDRGRNRVEIFESGDGTIIRRHTEVRALRAILAALESDRYVLHGQPIVALNDPTATPHFEVLLRLRTDAGDFVSVGEYLQAAERYQILERLDRWVVEHVLQSLAPEAELLRQSGVAFAVNITGQALSQPAFADFVRAQIEQHGTPAGILDFEFTETAAVRNLGAARRFIARMAETGASIALDDFGTGLSSLALLKDLTVQRIKIDGCFVRDILVNPRSQALVAALVQIARQLGLTTVGEFVENDAVGKHLRSIGVSHAQGYLYGRPRPLTDILAELREARTPTAVAAARR